MSNSETLTHLGKESRIPASPAEAVLDKAPAPSPGHLYLVRFTCPEFTCLCPITGQPDFAHLVLDYAPRDKILESKSFKLYLAAFRNQGVFHEAATTEIATRLVRELEPRWLRMTAFWFPRGGMPIDVFFQTGAPPQGLYVPDPGISPYRAR